MPFSIHRYGIRFTIVLFILTILFAHINGFFGYLFFTITVWCAYFFRDPDRVTPVLDTGIISPADGRIIYVGDVACPDFLSDHTQHDTVKKISIFMNIFNVHINRIPIHSTVKKITYIPGKFFNASFDKASDHNERSAMVLETDKGSTLGVVQIAGFIARRIHNTVSEGDTLDAGSRYGIICFGSRVDIYLPPEFTVHCLNGQITIAGETVLAS